MLHQEDPCCFHGCGRHERLEDGERPSLSLSRVAWYTFLSKREEYGRFVRSQAEGLFRTMVTEGNQHEVNPSLNCRNFDGLSLRVISKDR